MMTPTVNQVEELISHLSYQEQLWLLERLAHQLRTRVLPPSEPPPTQYQPALLSDDPAVQAELRETGARLIREAKAQQAEFARGWDEAMAKMGISGQPIGALALQQMLIAEGINPEDNEFSRGIVEMREE